MSNGSSHSWIISGRVLKIDGITPFINNDGLSVRLINANNVNHELANGGISDTNGNFSMTLNKQQFGSANPELILRVHDNQGRILYQSNRFTLLQSVDSHSVGNIAVIDMPVPHVWNILGRAFNNSVPTPFSQGLIYVYDGHTGVEYAHTGLWHNGQEGGFCLTFDRSRFQNGDVNKVAPYVILRIFDYNQRLLWQYGPFTVPHSDYYINPLVKNTVGSEIVPNIPIVPDNWSVSGTLFDRDNLPVTRSFTVKAFDVLHNNNEKFLGEVQSNLNGTYIINYTRFQFQGNDTGRTAPNLRIKVFSDGVLVASSGIFGQANNNQVINIHGIFVDVVIPQNWLVSGTVRDRKSQLLQSLTVKAFDAVNPNQLIPLGNPALTNTDGFYEIVYSENDFSGPAPDLLIIVYSDDGTERARGKAASQVTQNTTIDMILIEDEEWKVCGTVRDCKGNPVTYGAVNVYDVYSDPPVKLGMCKLTSGCNGEYSVVFRSGAFLGEDDPRLAPTLKVEYHYPKGTVLAERDVIENPGLEEEINLTLDCDCTVVTDEWEVTGTVKDSDGFLVVNGKVCAYNVYPGGEDYLGCARLTNAGQYTIVYNPAGDVQDVQMRVSSLNGTFLAQSEVKPIVKPKQTIDVVVQIPERGTSEYCVFGHITNRANFSVVHQEVEAYLLRTVEDNDQFKYEFSEVFLGRAITNANGYYEIEYDPEMLVYLITEDPVAHGAATSSLFIKLLWEPGVPPDISPVVCHSARRQQIDMQIDHASGSSVSEYEIVRSALSIYSVLTSNIDTGEPGFSNRIRYISCKTGVEEEKVLCYYYSLHISKWVNDKLASVSELIVRNDCDFEKFMYAAFRAEYPADVLALCTADPSKHYNVLTDAINNMVIPGSVTANLPEFWNHWLEIVRVLIPLAEGVPERWSVSGIVSRDGRIPPDRLTVRAYHKCPSQGEGGEKKYTYLGKAETNAVGAYTINYDKSAFQDNPSRTAPNLVIKVFSGDEPVAVSDVFYMAANHSKIDIDIISTVTVPEEWSVRGTILENDVVSSRTLTVKAFDGFSGEDGNDGAFLGETETNDGTYIIDYDKSKFQEFDSDRAAPSLFVMIYSGNDLVAKSETFDPAENHAVINVSFTQGNGDTRDRSVRGHVSENGKHSDVFKVRLFDRFPNQNETELGMAETDPATGRYDIEFKSSAYRNYDTGRVTPNLVVKVFGGDVLVAVKGPFYPSGHHTQMDIDIVSLNWQVSGKVKRHDNTLMNSGRVDAWDVYLGKEYPIGSSSLDANGDYSISFTKEKFQHEDNGEERRHPNLLIRIFDTNGVMAGYEYPPYTNSVDYVCSPTLKQTEHTFLVSGKITNRQGYPVSDSIVIVKNVFFKGGNFQETEVGRAISGTAPEGTQGSAEPGVYNISFHPEIVEGLKENESLDSARFVVEVCTMSDQIMFDDTTGSPLYPLGPMELAGKSSVIKAADEKLWEDIVIDALSNADVSIFTSINNQLLAKGFTVDSIVEIAADESKLEYAVELTDVSKDEMLTIALAESILLALRYKLKLKRSDIPDKVDRLVMYALVKTGNAESFKDLLKITADRLQTVLTSAITQSVIPPSVQNDLSHIVSEWQEIYSLLLQESTDTNNAGRIFWNAMLKPKANGSSNGSQNVPPNGPAIAAAFSQTAFNNSSQSVMAPSNQNASNNSNEFQAHYQSVLETYAEDSHDLEKFWIDLEERLTAKGVASDVIENLINRLKFFFDIHRFADEFRPLSSAMMEYVDERNDSINEENTGEEEYTSLEHFVRLEKNDWSSIIEKIEDFTDIIDPVEVTEWPELVPGESDEEKRVNYAAILYKRIIELFPMDRFISDLEKVMSVARTGFDSEWWLPVQRFLKINTAFDFAENITNDDFYCYCTEDQHTDPDIEYVPHYIHKSDMDNTEIHNFTLDEVQELYAKLLIVQRLYRLTPKLEVIDALREEGLTSAMSIAHKNSDEFVKEYGELVGGIDDAQTLHAAAIHTASQALFLMGTFNRQTDLQESSIPAVTDRLSGSGANSGTSAVSPVNFMSAALAPMQPMPISGQGEYSSVQSMSASSFTSAPGSNNASITRGITPIVPDIATLFGPQNQSLCEDCQSVFSPSAYTTDVLELLNDKVRSELFSRRPDLSETDLSCRNTNGGVAYIDLVNEILEDAVCSRSFYIENANPNVQSFFSPSSDKAERIGEIPSAVTIEFGKRGFYIDEDFYFQPIKDDDNRWYIVGDGWRYLIETFENNDDRFLITPYPQTGKDAQLRRVKPEHTHWGAYDVLKHSPYPTNLPFNLPFIEVNEFLKLKNSSRHDLYHAMRIPSEVFTDDGSGTPVDSMQAFFEMADKQKDLISAGAAADAWKLWGFSSPDEFEDSLKCVLQDSPNLSDSLRNAKAVMKKLDITLDQFLDLMHTFFVSRAGSENGDLLYLDWGKGHAYENGELDKLLINKEDQASDEEEILGNLKKDYSRIVRLQRLSSHLGLDVITVDRLLSMQAMQEAVRELQEWLEANPNPPSNTTKRVNLFDHMEINDSTLVNLFKYFKIAKEFSVSPIRASSWLCCWIENLNLGRGAKSQFEELFLSNIDNPQRAAAWKEMLNDTMDDSENIKQTFETSAEANDKDIAILLKSLKVNYNDLALIVQNEFQVNINPPGNAANLNSVSLTITNLAKMFRVADFSKVLGVSVSDFYKLKSILSASLNMPNDDFSPKFLIGCRSFLTKLKWSKISIDEFQYLLSGANKDKISWLPVKRDERNKGDALNTVIKIHNEISKTRLGYAENSPEVANAIKETVLNELAAVYKMPVDMCEIVLENALRIDSETSFLKRWVDICSGGWKADFYENGVIGTSSAVPQINIEAKSEIEFQKLPSLDVNKIKWTSDIVVPENAEYIITASAWLSPPEPTYTNTDCEDVDCAGERGIVEESAGTVQILNLDDSPFVIEKFEKGVVYPIVVQWEALGAIDLTRLNINCVWYKNAANESETVSSFIGPESTLRGFSEKEIHRYLTKIANVSFLTRILNISVEEFDFLTSYLTTGHYNSFDFSKLGTSNAELSKYKSLVALLDVYILDGELPFRNREFTIFNLLQEAQKSTSVPSFREVIARELDWPREDILTVIGSGPAADPGLFGFTSAKLRQTDTWSVLNRIFGLLKRLGLTASFARALISKADNSMSESEALIGALRATYAQSQWIEAAEPIRNNLRRIQRDALCAYLLSRRGKDVSEMAEFEVNILNSLLNYKFGTDGPLENESPVEYLKTNLKQLQRFSALPIDDSAVSDDIWDLLDGRTNPINRAAIYAKYLIDVSMDTDVMTTRIVQANSSIQMFLQRAILNFENIELDDKIKQQWSWMKNYRLWEANRKIFLYPENWLDPEFRDDKTPLFEELESNILQKELNQSNILEAFKAYSSGLSEVANLEIIGAYSDEGKGGTVLHVVGRSFHYPHSYYYRKNHDSGSSYWTPWEKIDLDITSDVVLPVPFRNKIYIFWPLIEVKEKAVKNEKSTPQNRSTEPQFSDSLKYYEIKLAWSEFSDGKWSAKRISQNTYIYVAENIADELTKPTDLFHFKAEVKSGEVEIQVFAYNKTVEKIMAKRMVIKLDRVRRLFGKRWRFRIEEVQEVIGTEETEAISRIATYSFGSDNSARLVSVEDDRDYMDKNEMIPPGTNMCHNRAEKSKDDQKVSDFGALEYPAKNVLFKRTPEQLVCFPTNLSFFENAPRPFFIRLNEKTLFVKPVDAPNKYYLNLEARGNLAGRLKQKAARIKQMLDSDNTVYHQMVNFYHPLADDLVQKANLDSVDGLLNRSTQANSRGDNYPLGYAAVGDEHAAHLADLSFQYQYLPQKTIIGGYPVPINDFSMNSAFGVYNWELFFHLPMYIATRLSRDNQFEEAMHWFHYIFNPAMDFTTWEKTQRWTWDLPEGARFWNFLPFFANRGVKDSIYKAVEKSQIPHQDTKLGSLIEDWKNDPFKPHLIARVRTAAYQKSVVMKYLDNLIEWGDSLFRLDHMEAINEATQLYTQASEILGERPVLVPKLHEMPGLTYRQLKAEGLDQFGNTIIQLENYITPPPPIKVRFWRAKQAPSRYYYYHYNYNYNYTYNSSVEAIPHRSIQLLRMAPALHYFCIPRNERLIGYWDVVDDRLFKIRHSMNIDGVKRVMPLFAPPIDPGMLARASAMGINIGALLRDMQGAPTAYRFATVFQKAVELCNELKSFGSELLSALEKKDAEALAILRNNHEIELLKLVKEIKKKTVEESTQNLEALLKTKAVTEERYNYYKEIEWISETETYQLAASGTAAGLHVTGQIMALASAPVALIPDALIGALVGLAGGPFACAETGGGKKTSDSISKLGNALIQSASIFDRIAGILSTTASYDRRWKEWKLQERLAKKELAQIDKQILSAQIRIQIAEKDLSNHDKQIEQAQAVKEVMGSKFSNERLYQWMADELTKSYNTMYDIAYSAAKKAEKAFQFELGSNQGFVSPEIWDSSRKGLLAGNRLSVQLRQMDAAYIENNRRELEITKAVSLNMLNPEELLTLRETGSCKIDLPELIYDLDCPGQFFRRIKSVRITIPCVAGPYTNVSAKLTLKESRVRSNATLRNGSYEEDPNNPDNRFLRNPIPIASISASGAMMDSGMFDLNFRDERYLPFEGAGAISTWSLELPPRYRQFDYGTITDVILHVSYTAREATSAAFRDGVTAYLDSYLERQKMIPNMISLREYFHDQFESIVRGEQEEISLNKAEHFPHLIVDYWRRRGIGISDISKEINNFTVFVLLKSRDGGNNPKPKINGIEADGIGLNLYYKREIEAATDGSLSLSVNGANGSVIAVEDIFLCFGYPVETGN